MKKYTKRLLAFLLATAMVVTGVPMSAKEAKAEDVSVTLDFGRPTGGTILATDYSWDESIETFDEKKNDYVGGVVSTPNIIDGTEPTCGVDNRLVNPTTLTKGQFVNKTVAVDRYSCGRIFTKSFAGANYVINPAKTTIPTMEGFDNVYINASKDTTPGLNIQSWNGTGAASYLQVCDGTVAFDFTVPVDGNYAVTVLSSTRIPSTAAIVAVNDVVIGATLPGSVASGTAEQPCNMESSVVLKAGETNTVSFTADASGRAWVRSITFTKLPAAYVAATMNVEEGATFDIGNVFELVTSAALDDGSAVESEALSVVYDSTNKEVATVTDNVLVAVAEGTTTITAAVSYNGEYKETISRNISVSFDGMFEVDFINDMDVTTLSTQKNGGYLTANTQSVVGADTVWSVNAEKSAATSMDATRWFNTSGLQYDINTINSPLAIDFEVPVSGKYDISADLYIYAARGSKVLVKINEDGEATLLSNRGGEPETQNLNTTYLNAGTNTIYISQNANGYFWIKGFTFTLNTTPEALPEYTVLWTDEAGNVLEEDIVAQGTVPTYDSEIPTKSADAQYTYTFAGWDKEVVAVTGDVTYVAQFTATAATYDLEVKLDFGRPTDGTILSLDYAWDESVETYNEAKNDYVGGIVTSPNVIDGTEPTYGVNDRLVDAKTLTKTQFLQQTVTVDRYHTARYLTKGFVGANYVINPEKTTFATVENVDNVYIFAEKDATPGLAIQSWSGNGAASYLQVCDGTVAFDFTVPEDGNYVVVATSCSRTPSKSATVAVNDVVIGATLPATLTTGSAGQDCGMNSTVNLKAGEINTVSFTADASGRAWIRSVTFLKVPANYVAATMNVEEGATFDIGNTFELVASAILDDEAVVSDERVSATFTSSNTDVATITDGVLVAVGEGETTITAEVSYNGEYKETITRTISVAFDGVFEVDFSETDPSTVVTDGKGRYYMDGNSKSKLGAGTVWSINAEQTSDTYKYDPVTNTNNSARFYGFAVEDGVLNLDNAYLQVGLGVDDVLAIDFEVPVEGRYAVDADMLLAANGARAKIKVGEDGRVAIVTSRSAESEVSTQPLKRVYLEKGTNTIYISQSIGTYFGINSITFTLDTVVDEFTVTWDVEGVTTTETYLEDSMPEYKGETPTKEADDQYTYTFIGWSPKLDDVIADITYTAVFRAEEIVPTMYNITWVVNETGEEATEEYEEGTMPESPIELGYTFKDEKYIYTFIGWDKEVVPATEDTTYTAVFDKVPVKYTVTWRNMDYTVLATEEYEYGQIPEYKGETPEFEGRDFAGWTPEIVPVCEDAYYTAQFDELPQFTITWVVAETEEEATEEYEKGTMPESPIELGYTFKDEKYIYTFIGWDKEVVPATEDTTYTAVFDKVPVKYTVTWMNFDGTVIATETYKYGETPEYKGETPVYNNYTFTGWSPEVAAVEGDATYTAQFEMSGKSIEWFDEDGDGVAETGYYYVDGAVKKGAGLVEVDGYLYWVLSTGKIALGTTRTIRENQTNGLIEAGTYYFLSNGILETAEVRLSGEIRWSEENGKQVGYYYVMDEVRKDVGLVEVWNEEAEETTWYYVLFSGKVKRNYVADGKRVNQTVKANRLNKYTGPEGLYSFYENGVMYDPLATESGIVKYDETGKPWYYVDGHIRKDAGLVYVQRGDLAGNYIFVTFSGTLKKGSQSIKEKTCNGHTEFIGTQRFDSTTGAMIIK